MDRKNIVEKTKKDNLLIEALDFIRLIVICLAILYVVPTFILRPLEVHGPSMTPTLENGDSVVTNVAAYLLFGVDRFDVVTLKEEISGEQWVKRIIALPHETIEYKQGSLYINQKIIEEPFLDASITTNDFGPITLVEDEYFVMGDNRNNSMDSRHRGPFYKSDILGKYAYVLYPFDRWRAVTDGN